MHNPICSTLTTFRSLRDETLLRVIMEELRAQWPEYAPDTFRIPVGRSFLEATWGNISPLGDLELGKIVMDTEPWWLRYFELLRGAPAYFSMHVSAGGLTPYDFAIICRDRILPTSEADVSVFVEIATRLFELSSAFFGDIGTSATAKWTTDERGLEHLAQPDLSTGLPPPEWGLFLGRDYVDLIGREKLASAPCEVKKELPGGGFMLLLTEKLSDLESSTQYPEVKRRALVDHVGHDLFSYIPSSHPKRVLRRLQT